MKEEIGRKASDYVPRDVEAARRVMTELAHILGAYRDGFVLVGGWVPDLLLPDARPAHVGSLDVDLLLNPDRLKSGKYSALLLVYSLRNWPGGSTAVAERIKPYLGDRIVKETLGILDAKFRSAGDYGPQCVALFLDSGDPEERAFHAQDAFQRVGDLLDALGMHRSPAP